MSLADILLSAVGGIFNYKIQTVRESRKNLSNIGPDQKFPSITDTLTAMEVSSIVKQAESKQPQRLFRIYTDMLLRDDHILAELGKRIIAVAGEDDVLTAVDDSPEAQLMLRRFKTLIDDLGIKFIDLKKDLLLSALYPVCVEEIIYQPSKREGWYYTIGDFNYIDPTALKFDSPGRKMTILVGDELNPEEVEPKEGTHIVHRSNVLSAFPDYLGGPGRTILFWWLFKTMDRSWWVDFLERFGQPFLVGKYDPGTPEEKYTLANAFSAARRFFGIAISKDTEVRVEQISTANADAFKVFTEFANAQISKVIVGQTLSSTAQSTGLGNGQADMQENVRQDFRKFDALLLSFTIRDQVFRPLCRLNGWPEDLAPYYSAGKGDTEEAKRVMSGFLKMLPAAGLEITDEAIPNISEIFGVPVQRKVSSSSGFGFPLSSLMDKTIPLSAGASKKQGEIPGVRKKSDQAMTANEKICAASLSPFKDALGEQYKPILQALSASASRAEFITRLKEFSITPNPEAVAALEQAITSASANGILRSQPDI